jgi:dihydroorotate dehydrogenase (NAD+) catalytic subunit
MVGDEVLGTLNAMGLPNPGVDLFVEELGRLGQLDVPVIGSVFGGDASDYARVAGRLAEAGCRAVELNLSCPNARRLGMELGEHPEDISAITRAVVDTVDVPVWAKLSPNTSRIVELAAAARDGGAGAVVLTNTLKAMALNVEAARPVLTNTMGGLGGPALKPVALRCVWEVHRELGGDIDMVGVGGVATVRDALEYLMAGARAVQVGSAVAQDGPELFSELGAELEGMLEDLGHGSVDSVIGLAHREGRR